MKKRGFTLIELTVVVAVLGVMLAIAVPAYSNARTRTHESACAKNKGLFDQAKQLWMVDNNKSSSDEVLFKDLLPEYIVEPPVCPSQGHYVLGTLTTPASCTVHP